MTVSVLFSDSVFTENALIWKKVMSACRIDCYSYMNDMKTHNDLAGPSIVYFEKISVLSISECFSISFFSKLVVNLQVCVNVTALALIEELH